MTLNSLGHELRRRDREDRHEHHDAGERELVAHCQHGREAGEGGRDGHGRVQAPGRDDVHDKPLVRRHQAERTREHVPDAEEVRDPRLDDPAGHEHDDNHVRGRHDLHQHDHDRESRRALEHIQERLEVREGVHRRLQVRLRVRVCRPARGGVRERGRRGAGVQNPDLDGDHRLALDQQGDGKQAGERELEVDVVPGLGQAQDRVPRDAQEEG